MTYHKTLFIHNVLVRPTNIFTYKISLYRFRLTFQNIGKSLVLQKSVHAVNGNLSRFVNLKSVQLDYSFLRLYFGEPKPIPMYSF